MSEWKAKRFWKTASVADAPGGFTVELDGRSVKTPAKALLVVPSHALAARIAEEWDAQGEVVDPLSMPYTRSANAAIDKVTHQHGEVAQLLADYGDADLLCYRAEGPDSLIARQKAAWDPILDWAAEVLEARLTPVTGVIHRPQSPDVLAGLSARVHAMDAFTLTAFHDLVGMSGSLILGFAALYDHKPAAEIWQLSRVDELWQAEQWGDDDEALELAAKKESDFLHAKSFHDLASRPSD
ncbi:ATP12 family chaperone protein [Roseovarius sp. 2305UL8-3]|uniref:ATP12 family chaperone protein n=1 Tax=Roseovarius conchicola TaxID=3121636 RepID=UPI0035280681